MIILFILTAAVVLIVTGIRGTVGDVGEILKSDFTGNNNFLGWIVAVWIIGFIASFESSRGLGRAFYGLLIVVLLLSNRGFFAELERQLLAPSTPTFNTGNFWK